MFFSLPVIFIIMNYQRIYNQIVERAQNRKLDGYKERHHVIPKCLGGSNDKSNLVDLTAKEHFLCHKLLCEIHPNNHKLLYALWLMAIGKQKNKKYDAYKVTSREYERVKILFVKQSKLKTITDKHKEQVAKANSKKILQYDLQGNFIKEWSSSMEAERFISNKPNAHWKELGNNINSCCLLKQKSAYGYIWKYKGDNLDLNQHIGSNRCFDGKKVICVLNNKIFKNQKEAIQNLKISNHTFYKMIKNSQLKYEY